MLKFPCSASSRRRHGKTGMTNCGLPCIRSNQHPGSPQTRWLQNVGVVSREACLRYNAIPNVLFIEISYRSVMQFDDVVRIQRGEHVHIFQLWPGCSKKHARHHVLALTATNGPLANILLKTTGNSHIFCFFCLSFSFPFFFVSFVFFVIFLFFNQFSKSLSQGLSLVCVSFFYMQYSCVFMQFVFSWPSLFHRGKKQIFAEASCQSAIFWT